MRKIRIGLAVTLPHPDIGAQASESQPADVRTAAAYGLGVCAQKMPEVAL